MAPVVDELMALPAFRSAGTLAHDIVGVTPAAPSGLTLNDIELLACESMDEAISLATPAGFVEVAGSPISVSSGTATIATRGALFWRRWDGSAGDPTTNDPGNHILARRSAYSDCILTGDPWDILVTSSEATEDTSGSATGGTTNLADCLIAVVIGSAKPDSLNTAEVSSWANTDLATVLERYDGAGNSGNGGHLGLATGEKATAGSFGPTTYTKATSAFKWHFVVALKPLSVVTAPPAARRQDGGPPQPLFIPPVRTS